jgi:hypothetical protein
MRVRMLPSTCNSTITIIIKINASKNTRNEDGGYFDDQRSM